MFFGTNIPSNIVGFEVDLADNEAANSPIKIATQTIKIFHQDIYLVTDLNTI